MEDGSYGAFFGAQAEAHVDVADLRRGGEGDHTVDVVLFDGAEGSYDHGDDTEDEDDIGDAGLNEDIEADDAVDHFNEHHDVGFGDQAGENRTGAGGGGAVSVGHPEMEGKKSALYCDTRNDKCYHNRGGNGVVSRLPYERKCFLYLREEQVPRHGIHKDDAYEEKTRADEAEYHISCCSHKSASVFAYHKKSTGGKGAYLNEHVARENVVGIAESEERDLTEIDHRVVIVALSLMGIALDASLASDNGEEHHYSEKCCEEGLEQACGYLISPRGGIVAHHICKLLAREIVVNENAGVHRYAQGEQGYGDLSCRLTVYNEGCNGRKQAQYHHEEGKVADEIICQYHSAIPSRIVAMSFCEPRSCHLNLSS